MKTPEQIATEVNDRNFIGTYRNSKGINGAGFRQAIAVAAIEADRAQRPPHIVAIRDGEAFEGVGVEVINMDFLDYAQMHREFDQDDIDKLAEKLTQGGLPSAADDLREWWADQ